RHDVGGVAGEEEPAEAHRLGDEAAQRRDALLDRRTGDERVGRSVVEARAKLGPEGIVAPAGGSVVERALDVVAAARRRAHAAEREAALVVRIDELVRDRRRLREHAEPAERIDALVVAQRAVWHALPADAVVAIAAGDEVAIELRS